MAKARYNWTEWLDGQRHLLARGKDFDTLVGLRGAATYQALKRDGRVKIWQEYRGSDTHVYIQFLKGSKEKPVLDRKFISQLMELCHPDLHEGNRKTKATKIFQSLSNLRDEMGKDQ